MGCNYSSSNCSDGTASASTAALRSERSFKAQESKRQPVRVASTWPAPLTHHQDARHVEVTNQVERMLSSPVPTVISYHDLSKSEVGSYRPAHVGKEKFCPVSNICHPTSEVGMIPRYLMPGWMSNSVRHASRATEVISLLVWNLLRPMDRDPWTPTASGTTVGGLTPGRVNVGTKRARPWVGLKEA